MKGKILGQGAISGDDGKRYYYDEAELKNAQPNQKIDGAEVDFDIKGDKAVGVYIISKASFSSSSASVTIIDLPIVDNKWMFLNLNEAKSFFLAPNIHSMKIHALLCMVLYFITTLFLQSHFSQLNKDGSGALIGFYCFIILSSLSAVWVNYSLFKLSDNNAPLKYTCIIIVLTVIACFLVNPIIRGLVTYVFGGSFPLFKVILLCLCIIAIYALVFLWFCKVSSITSENCFLYSFFAWIIAQIFFFVAIYQYLKALQYIKPSRTGETLMDISTLLGVIAIALIIFAWLRFRTINANG